MSASLMQSTMRLAGVLQQHYYENNVDLLVDSASRFVQHVLRQSTKQEDSSNTASPVPFPDCLASEYLLANITAFLPLRDMGSLASTCRTLRAVLDPRNHQYAQLFFSRVWEAELPGCRSHEDYIRHRMDWERHELRHFTTLMPLMRALKCAPHHHQMVEISGNLGRFPSREIALAVSKRRPQALAGVLIPRVELAIEFRHLIRGFVREVNFMITSPPESTKPPRPRILAEGFVGYAIEILELRPHEQHLRETVLSAMVYRDLTVWRTYEDVVRAVRTGQYAVRLGDRDGELEAFFCVLQDDRDSVVQQAELAKMKTTASWGRYRPALQDIRSPVRYCKAIRARIEALERALEAV